MTDASAMAAFDEVFDAYGGRIDPTTLQPPWANFLTMYQKRLNEKMLGARREASERGDEWSIEAHYINGTDFNAFAWTNRGIDVLAINAGALFRVATVMHILVSQPTAFKDVGEPSQRPVQKDLDAEAYKSGVVQEPPALIPSTSPEYQLVSDLIAMAADFLTAHESAHLTNGHVRWINLSYGPQKFSEIGMASTSGLSDIDLQTLEFDADATAVQQVVTTMLVATPRREGTRNHFTFPTVGPLGPIPQVVKMMSFAIYTCCKMLEHAADATTIQEALDGDHPPARFRMACAIQQIVNVIHVQGGLPLRGLMEPAVQGAHEAETAWAAAFGQERASNPLNDPLASQLLQLYRTNWTKLHPALVPHSRFGKLAPAVNDTPWKLDQA